MIAVAQLGTFSSRDARKAGPKFAVLQAGTRPVCRWIAALLFGGELLHDRQRFFHVLHRA